MPFAVLAKSDHCASSVFMRWLLVIPAVLKPNTTLPLRLAQPSSRFRDVHPSFSLDPPVSRSVQLRPDRIIGPRIRNDDTSGIAVAVWEIPKLYHDRPLFTRSKGERISRINGLLLSGKGLRKHQSQSGGGARLNYTLRAANVPEAVRGALVLR